MTDTVNNGDLIYLSVTNEDSSSPPPPDLTSSVHISSGVLETYLAANYVKGRVLARPASLVEIDFMPSVFRILPRQEYSASKALKNCRDKASRTLSASSLLGSQRGKSGESRELIPGKEEASNAQADHGDVSGIRRTESTMLMSRIGELEERADYEQKQNELETQRIGGTPVFYGQTVQLMHFSSGMYVVGLKNESAELEFSCLKCGLSKGGSADCWFKIMPRFKVRFEGEQVKQLDQVVFIHLKSGQFLHLSDKVHADAILGSKKGKGVQGGPLEVNLYNSHTGWTIRQFAKFTEGDDKYLKCGDVCRLFHQEVECFLKAELPKILDSPRRILKKKKKNVKFAVESSQSPSEIDDGPPVHAKGKTGRNQKKDSSTSSNTMFQVELENKIHGGSIAWDSQCRFKHLGTGLHLCVNDGFDEEDNNGKESKLGKLPRQDSRTFSPPLGLVLTSNALTKRSLFTIHPVDRTDGQDIVSYGSYFRLQHTASGKWFNIGSDKKIKYEDRRSFATRRKGKVMTVEFSDKLRYQDVLVPLKVQQSDMDNLINVNGFWEILDQLVAKLTGRHDKFESELRSSSGLAKAHSLDPRVDILPAVDALEKMDVMVNDPDRRKRQQFQRLFFEQHLDEKCIEVLLYMFDHSPDEWIANPRETGLHFMSQVPQISDDPVRRLLLGIYRFLRHLIEDNEKCATRVASWLEIFMGQIGAKVGVRDMLIDLFSDNGMLLNKIATTLEQEQQLPQQTGMEEAIKPRNEINVFLDLLLVTKERDPRTFEFFAILCACKGLPVLHIQNYILENVLISNFALIFETKVKKGGKILVDIGDSFKGERKWLDLEDLVCDKAKTKAREKQSGGKRHKLQYCYNKAYSTETKYFEQQLVLYKNLLLGSNEAALEVLCDKGIKHGKNKVGPVLEYEEPFLGAMNRALPPDLRGAYIDLMYQYIDADLPPISQFEVHLTWGWSQLDEEYLFTDSHDKYNDKLSERYKQQSWILEEFLVEAISTFSVDHALDKDYSGMYLSLLNSLQKMISLGFYTSREHQNKFFTGLISMLGVCANVAKRKNLDPKSIHRISTSALNILLILHQYFDVRLEENLGKELSHFKKVYSDGELESEDDERNSSSSPKLQRGHSALHMDSLFMELQTFGHHEHSVSQPHSKSCNMEDSEFIKVLQKLTQFKNPELNSAALSFLFRLLCPVDELISYLKKVQILTDNYSLSVYQKVVSQITALRWFIKDNDISEEEMGEAKDLLTNFIHQCANKENLKRLSLKNQTILRNLNVHKVILDVLHMPYKPLYNELFKLCYLFLGFFCHENKRNQAELFPYLEFFLSQMGYKLDISDMLISLLGNNFELCSQLDSSLVIDTVKLLVNKGHIRKYLNLLSTMMGTKDHLVPEVQVNIVTQLISNRYTVMNEYQHLPLKDKAEKPFSSTAYDLKFVLAESVNLSSLLTMKKQRVRDDDLEQLLYHAELIDLLARCCQGENYLTEVSCQDFLPLDDVCAVLLDKQASIALKGPYTRFLTEVWIFTERRISVFDNENLWKVIASFNDHLRTFKGKGTVDPRDEDELFYVDFVFVGILPFFKTFVTVGHNRKQKFHKSKNTLLEEMVSSVISIIPLAKNNPEKLQTTAQCLEAFKEAKLVAKPDSLTKTVEKIRKQIHLTAKTMRQVEKTMTKEKQIRDGLTDFVHKMKEDREKSGEEDAQISQVFHASLFRSRDTHTPSCFMDEVLGLLDEDLVSSFQMGQGNVQKCTKLQCDILEVLANMIENEKSSETQREIQTKLGQKGALVKAITLFQSTNPKIVTHAIEFCCQLFAGGNKVLQGMMMDWFLATPDPTFFVDIKNRIAWSIDDFKARRKQKMLMMKRKGGENVQELQNIHREDENDGGRDIAGKQLKLLLQFIQNLCEGHNIAMKNYLRDQHDNNKSFNLPHELSLLAIELEKMVEGNEKVVNQLYRTLTELASGCEANSVAFLDAKIFVPINKLFQDFSTSSWKPQKYDFKILVSVTEFLLSLVEGKFPEKEDPADISRCMCVLLLQHLDFVSIEKVMANSKPFLHKPSDETIDKTIDAQCTKANDFILDSMMLLNILKEYCAFIEGFEDVYKMIEQIELWPELAKRIGRIEIVRGKEKELERIYFPLPDQCKYVDDTMQNELMRIVNRETPTAKIDDFMKKSDNFIYQMMHNQKLKTSKLSFFSNYSAFRKVLTVLTLLINALMITCYVEGERDFLGESGQLTLIPFLQSDIQVSPHWVMWIILGLSVFHVIFAFLFVSGFGWVRWPILVFRGRRHLAEKSRFIKLAAKGVGTVGHGVGTLSHSSSKKQPPPVSSWIILVGDVETLYMFGFLILSILGLIFPPLYAFHALDVPLRNRTTLNVLKAVTQNGTSILLTALLGVMVIYGYAMIAFFTLRVTFDQDEGLLCDTLLKCVLTTLNFGTRAGGGIGDELGPILWQDPLYFFLKFLFEMTFFLAIIIVLLNVVFGIILDTFGELRDEKRRLDEDIRNNCFICNRESDIFQQKALGFKHHIKFDHNMWHYIYFLIYLKEKDPDEHTFSEGYVFEKRQENDNSWVPIGRAIVLKETQHSSKIRLN